MGCPSRKKVFHVNVKPTARVALSLKAPNATSVLLLYSRAGGYMRSGEEELACIKVDNIDRVNRPKFLTGLRSGHQLSLPL